MHPNSAAWRDGRYAPYQPVFMSKPKLSPVERDEIAYERGDGITAKVLAAKYGVSSHTIYNILPRERPYAQ